MKVKFLLGKEKLLDYIGSEKMYIKVILKNMIDNRKKYVLLLISICMSTALFVLSFVSTRTINNMASENITTLYGSTDLILSASEKNKSVFFDDDVELKGIKEQLPMLCANTTYRETETVVYGTEIKKMQNFIDTLVLDGKELDKLGKDEIIISYKSSKKFNLKVGDTIELGINEKDKKFKVGAVAQEKGILGQEDSDFYIICHKSEVEDIYGIEDVSNIMYAKTGQNKNSEGIISDLKKEHEELNVTEITVGELLSGVTSNISRPLYIMLIMIVIMSIFIIYSAEKLIVMEIMPFIGTLLSVGATKIKVNFILMAEAVFIGLFGGILGNFLGAGASYIIMDSANEYKDIGIQTHLPPALDIYVAALLFAMLLALVSTLIPILSVNKISTKNIVLNLFEKSSESKGIGGSLWGVCLLVAAILMTVFNKDKQNPYVAIGAVIVIIVSLFLIITPLVRLFIHPLLMHMQDYNVPLWMATNSLKTSDSLMNNIKLASICILTLNVICIVSTSVIGGISNVWDSYKSDIQITGVIDKDKTTGILAKESDVDFYVYTGNCSRVDVEGNSTKILSLIGVEDTGKYLDYNHYFDFHGIELDVVNEGKNILLSEAIASKFDKKEGEDITLLNSDGEKFTYHISALFNAKMESMGMVAIIGEKNMEKDFKEQFSTSLFISVKGNDTNIGKEYTRLKDKLDTYVTKVEKESELKENTLSDNESMIRVLKQVSIFNLIIGCFGIINNIMISFLQRRKELAVLETIGMTFGKKFLMLISESIICAIACMLIGLGATVMVSLNLPGIFRIMGTSIDLIINRKTILEYILITGGLMVVSNFIVIVKDRKNDILSVVRFE